MPDLNYINIYQLVRSWHGFRIVNWARYLDSTHTNSEKELIQRIGKANEQ